MSKVYFITHPDVVVDPAKPVPQWPLSEKGLRRMRSLLERKWIADITSIYCSREQKAIDGARVLADHLRQSYQAIESLGENDRSSTGYLPHDVFESLATQFFTHPDRSVKGWEKATDAQNRIVGTVKDIVDSDPSKGDIAIVAHGGVGTLLLCRIANWSIDRSRDQPGSGGGHYFCFERDAWRLAHGWKAIDPD